MRPANLVIILSDEHNRDVVACYGDPIARTPNLDRLAARGAVFRNAYCNCPICVPSRASIATGRYVHETGCWDNANPYTGHIPSWGHRLIPDGHEVVSVGKLHYRDEVDDNGFTQEILPLHVLDGVGDLLGLLRDPPAPRGKAAELASLSGCGHSAYTQYDRQIAEAACTWLKRDAPRHQPWVLFIGFVLPHFPLIAPPEFFELYDVRAMPLPRLRHSPSHPVLTALRQCMNYDDFFDDDTRRMARTAYYGMVSYLDHNIGRVLAALEETGFADETRIIYTSDHGDNLGERGLWGKSVMYEESAAVPLILAGPGIPECREVVTPVSLVDLYPTVLACLGKAPSSDEERLPGRALTDLFDGEESERVAFSEYHAAGAMTGMFMVRWRDWKYVHYPGYPPQLFNLAADPRETRDLAHDPGASGARERGEALLFEIVDPGAVNAQAFRDQARMIAAHGGAEAIRRRGTFGYTPAPGETPTFA